MTAQRRSPNLPLLAIVLEGFFSRLSFGVVNFALPLYAVHLGLSLAEIGVLVSVNTIVAILLKPAMGTLVDRVGLKRSLTAAIAFRSLVVLLFALARLPWQLFVIRSVHGLPKSLRDPSINALIAEHGGKKTVASAFAWYTTAKKVAGDLGRFVSGVLLTLLGSNFSLVFAFGFLLSLVPLYTTIRYVTETRRSRDPGTAPRAEDPTPAREPEHDVSPPGRQRRPALAPFVGLGFLISATAQMLRGLLPVLATTYAGLSEAETGSLFLISAAVVLVSGPAFGWLADNVSHKLVLMIRSTANSVSSLIFIISPTLFGFTLGKAVDEIGKAAFRPAWGALMARVSSFDRSRRAQTMSLMSMGEDMGSLAGPMLAGLLCSVWGVPIMFGVRIALAVVSEVYSVVVLRGLDRMPDQES